MMGLRTIGKKKETVQKGVPKRTVVILGILFIIGISAILFNFPQDINWSAGSSRWSGELQLTKQEILNITDQEQITKEFIKENQEYTTRILFLTQRNMSELSGKYPAIYSDLPAKNMYRVEYTSENGGVLLILDPDRGVVKYYRVHKGDMDMF